MALDFPSGPQSGQGYQGSTGTVWIYDATSASWKSQVIVGSQGVQGAQGVQGVQGAQGVQGSQGNRGYYSDYTWRANTTTTSNIAPQSIHFIANTISVHTTTAFYLNNDSSAGGSANLQSLLETWDDSTSPFKGYLTVTLDPRISSVRGTYEILEVKLHSGYIEILVDFISGSEVNWSSISGYDFSFGIDRTGNLGAQGVQGAQGFQGVQGASGSGTYRVLFKPESASFPATGAAQYKTVSGTNYPVESLAFGDAASENCFFKFITTGYTSGNMTVTFNWYADTATSGVVVWEAQLAAITPNSDTQDIETKAFGTAQNVSDTHLGTTGQRLHTVDLTLSNIDSVAANDYCVIRVGRTPLVAADTMAGDALLTDVIVSYT